MPKRKADAPPEGAPAAKTPVNKGGRPKAKSPLGAELGTPKIQCSLAALLGIPERTKPAAGTSGAADSNGRGGAGVEVITWDYAQHDGLNKETMVKQSQRKDGPVRFDGAASVQPCTHLYLPIPSIPPTPHSPELFVTNWRTIFLFCPINSRN